MQISKTTVENAYYQLTAEGYLCSVPGKGSFVAARQQADPARLRKLWSELDKTVSELCFLGVSREEIARRVTAEEEGAET